MLNNVIAQFEAAMRSVVLALDGFRTIGFASGMSYRGGKVESISGNLIQFALLFEVDVCIDCG